MFRSRTALEGFPGEAVLTVSHGACAAQALIQLSSGSLLRYQDGHLTPLPALPELCVSVRAAGPNVFARALNCHLYVDGELIANNVTSFFCLPGFLVMTLNTHQLATTRADTGYKVCIVWCHQLLYEFVGFDNRRLYYLYEGVPCARNVPLYELCFNRTPPPPISMPFIL